MLDTQDKSCITASEIYSLLTDLGYYAHKELIYMFVRRFDRDNDSKLLYSDFCDAFTPKSVTHSIALSSRKSYYLHNHYLRREFF
jgi:Ca2+-binding EF-hand superfamily protein